MGAPSLFPRGMSADEVLLHLTEENCPLVLKLRNRQWTCVTMPMRLDEATPTPEKEDEESQEA